MHCKVNIRGSQSHQHNVMRILLGSLGILGLLGFFNSQAMLKDNKKMLPSFAAAIVLADEIFQHSVYIKMKRRGRLEQHLSPLSP